MLRKRFLKPLFVLLLFAILLQVSFVKTALGKLAFRAALNPIISTIVGLTFELVAPLLPVQKQLINTGAIAFNHPRPAWETHYLIVPRKRVRNIFRLLEPANKQALHDVLVTAAQMLKHTALEPPAYSLLVNGGIRQDVKQVHFHLNNVQGYARALEAIPAPENIILQTEAYQVFAVTSPEEHLHFILLPAPLPPLSKWNGIPQNLLEHTLPLQALDERYQLSTRGFSLIMQEVSELEKNRFIIHLTVGKL